MELKHQPGYYEGTFIFSDYYDFLSEVQILSLFQTYRKTN